MHDILDPRFQRSSRFLSASVLLTLASGCPVMDVTSDIAPGAYFGTLTTTTIVNNGGNTTTESASTSITKVFGNSGLPVENGKEVFVGHTGTFSVGAISGTEKVTSVLVSGTTVTVEYDAVLQIGDLRLTGVETDVFTGSGDAVTIHEQIIVANESMALTIELDGTVAKQ